MLLLAVPEGVAPPFLHRINDTAVNVTWTTPVHPNGVIIYYVVYVNDGVAYNGSLMSHLVTNLNVDVDYFFSIAAYTSAGGARSLDTSLPTIGEIEVICVMLSDGH